MIGKDKRSSLKQDKLKESKIKNSYKSQEDILLKTQQVERQINLLNEQITCLMFQKSLKQSLQGLIIKQRKSLQSNFLYKSFKKASSFNQKHLRQNDSGIQITKNNSKDVNQSLRQFIKAIQNIDKKESNSLQEQETIKGIDSQEKDRLNCQSMHLKQIFNAEIGVNYKQRSQILREKVDLMYGKIKQTLEREEPYLHEKILEKIKRQGQKQSQVKLLFQINKLIKENSEWMVQQKNQVNNKLEQSIIEERTVNNLTMMKKIMSKKVGNNDFIYENYGQDREKSMKTNKMSVLMGKIKQGCGRVIRRVQERRVQGNSILKNRKRVEQRKEEESLRGLVERMSQGQQWGELERVDQRVREAESQLIDRLSQAGLLLERVAK